MRAVRLFALDSPAGAGSRGRSSADLNRVESPLAKPDPPPSSPADSLNQLHVRDGYQVELVASEPMVVDPVAIDWGADGRLWVVEMADYPLGMDGKGSAGGRIRFLEDSNGDGRYDKSTLFLENINFPNGILAWRDGVLVTGAPDIIYAEDTDGDGRADLQRVLYTGFSEGNQQLRVNGLRWGLDNWVHCANGLESRGEVKSTTTGATADMSGRDVRIRPDDGRLDAVEGRSQFGRIRDAWGNWFGLNNSYPIWHYVLPDRYTRRNPHAAPPDSKQMLSPGNPMVYPAKPSQKRFHSFEQSGRFTSACGPAIYRDQLLFGDGDVRHAFTCEPFHNLVQHNLVTNEGVSFQLQRDESDGPIDFLASADRWCRPVMARTGPDGALWVVDVYRYMIEHPRYLGPEGREELRPHYREGDDRGRIYRIFPQSQEAQSQEAQSQEAQSQEAQSQEALVIPQLHTMSPTELVDQLESPNGWIRDKAHQMLLWLNDPSVTEKLEQLVTSSSQAVARLQALCVLDGLDELSQRVLVHALSDEHADVRRHAVRMTESVAQRGMALKSAVIKLVDDSDAQVRLQLAFTLGAWGGDRDTARVLEQLARQGAENPYLAAAVISSIHVQNVMTVLSNLLAEGDTPAYSEHVLGQLLITAAAVAADKDLAVLLDLITTKASDQDSGWTFATIAQLSEALAKHNRSLAQLVDSADPSGRNTREALEGIFASARHVAMDAEADPADRKVAIGSLGRGLGQHDDDRVLLTDLLVVSTPPAVQAAAVEQLGGLGSDDVPGRLLANWEAHSPALRSRILSTLLSRGPWLKGLLDEIEKGRVLPADLDTVTQRSLAEHRQEGARAKRLLATSSTTDRQQVLEDYRGVLELSGSASRGKANFKKTCTACHKLGGEGSEVGPNLASLTDKSVGALLNSILDPSRSVDARYMNYVAFTADGRTYSGMIAGETGNSVTLIGQDGKEQVLLRGELEELTSTGKSMMPDGLEKDLSVEDLADLIAYAREARE